MKPRYKAWYGGECPVLKDTFVQVVFRSNSIDIEIPARVYCWDHDGGYSDIIAYRVIEENDDGTTR